MIKFTIDAVPVAKQSFRYTRTGIRYQTKAVKDYQKVVAERAAEVWHYPPTRKRLVAKLHFRVTRDIADLDNLAKAVLDGLQGVVYKNDRQIKLLTLSKENEKPPGIDIVITYYEDNFVQKIMSILEEILCTVK